MRLKLNHQNFCHSEFRNKAALHCEYTVSYSMAHVEFAPGPNRYDPRLVD
jgi:hypothetical protein